MISSTGRTAIVTGGARGIGAATAQRLAAKTVASIEEAGGKALAVGADVSDTDQVNAAVARVAEQLGPPLVLVNNAGIVRDNLLFKMSDDDWDQVVAVHLRGSFLMTRATQSHMVEAGWGRIVNMSSVSALGNRGQVNYAAAKAGLQGFTKTLSIELGRFGITANAIAPGFIVTDMTRGTAERMGVQFDQFVEAAVVRIPVARVGEPGDIANAVAFFVSEQAGFVSGQVLYVAGGPRT
jgi:3-oxoacyl-[acyl-carrier protein] reductase